MPLLVDGQRVRLPRSAAELVRAHPLLEVSGSPGPAGRVGSRQPGHRRAFTRDLLRWGPESLGDLRKVSQHVRSARTRGPPICTRRALQVGVRVRLPALPRCRQAWAGGPVLCTPIPAPPGLGGLDYFLARNAGFVWKLLALGVLFLPCGASERGLIVKVVVTKCCTC